MTRIAQPPTARGTAIAAVAAALQGNGYLSDSLAGAALDARDAGLAREIAFGAVRHHFTINGLLGRFAEYDERRTPPMLRATLHCAVYQLVWMTGVPPFAAADEAVTIARAGGGPKAAAMVNAVLRRISAALANREATWDPGARDCVRTGWDRACRLSEQLFPADSKPGGEKTARSAATENADELRRIALLTGERPARLKHLAARFGQRDALKIAWASQAVPPTILYPNTKRISRTEFAVRVAEELGEQATTSEGAAFVAPGARVATTTLLRDGFAYVQDTTAHAAAALVEARKDETILDLCAAPGGKSIALALRGAVVLACDVDERRLARVSENATRLGLSKIEMLKLRCGNEREDLAAACQSRGIAAFDAALIDAPCSNTGVIARRPEARLGLTPTKLASLTALQRRLLEVGAAAIRPGRRMVYSTCSIEREENEDIVQSLLASHARWTLEAMQLTLPQWGATVAEWRDGGFAALLRKG